MIEQYMWIVWLVVFVLSIIIEACTLELVSIFFSLGSIVALILSFITGVPYYIELVVFVVLSVISLVALRPVMSKILNKEKRLTNIDEFVGKEVRLTKAYHQDDLGETKIDSVIWRVLNIEEKEPMEVGQEVLIVSVKGNKLVVKKKGE